MRNVCLAALAALLLTSCSADRVPRLELPIVTDATFEKEVLQHNEIVLVDFGAVWCPPCHMATPILEEIRAEFEGKAKVVKLDIDDSPVTADRYDVTSLPTFIIFKDGKELTRRGLPTTDAKPRLTRWLNEALE
jgi:thioredoxin 1